MTHGHCGGGFSHHHGGFQHHHCHHHQHQGLHHHKHHNVAHHGHKHHHHHGQNGHQPPCPSSNPWITNPAVLFPIVDAKSVPANRTPPLRRQVVFVGGGEEPHLQRVSVQLPAHAYAQARGVTYFAVDVFPEDGGAPWRVMRRYTEFRWLSRSVDTTAGTVFPPKHGLQSVLGIPLKDWELEDRRRGLESWLQDVISKHQESDCTSGSEILRDFLVLRRGACPDAFTTIPEATAPPADEEPLMLLTVELPDGAGYGNLVTIAVDALGQMRNITFAVPWGVTPGMPIELWYDTRAGSVGVHAQQHWQALRQ